MAYRQEDKENNLFKRNTQYENFGGVLCCSCKLCVERDSTPTLTIKNFRPRPNQIPELPPLDSYDPNGPYATKLSYIEFTQDVSGFGEQTYLLDFENFFYENWDSQDLKKRYKYAKSLTYYPFRNCNGSPTSLTAGFTQRFGFNDFYYSIGGSYYIETIDPFSPDNAPYGSLFNSGAIALRNSFFSSINYYYYNQLSLSYNLNPYYINLVFQLNRCNTSIYPAENVNGYTYLNPLSTLPCDLPLQPGQRSCTNSEISQYISWAQTFIPPTPPNPITTGDTATLFNYIENHDFSLGVNVDNNCTNNISAIANVMPLKNYTNYQFQSTYPTSIETSRQSYFREGTVENHLPIDSPSVVSSGYVLSYFNYDFSNPTIYFSIIPIKDVKFYVFNCSDLDYETTYNSVCSPLYISTNDSCWYITAYSGYKIPFLTEDWYISHNEFMGSFKFYPTLPSRMSSKYIDGDYQGSSIDASFGYYYSDIYNDIFNLSYFWYYQCSIINTNNGTKTVETDPDGNTKVIFKDMLFTGPNYLKADYQYKDQQLNYNIGTYSKYLSIGFQCDIEINYKTTPACSKAQIPQQLSRVNEYKVKLENYRPYEQPNFASRDTVSYLRQENPYDAGIYSTIFDSVYRSYNALSHVIYAPPDVNQNNEFIINKNGIIKSTIDSENFEYKTYDSKVSTSNYYRPTSGYYDIFSPGYIRQVGSVYGRIFAFNYELDEYKNTMFVSGFEDMWETGNEITIQKYSSESHVPYSFNPTKIGNTFRKYYCIFVKKISEENTQNAGSIQIKLANTYSDAMNGIEIPISEYSTGRLYDSYIQLTVKYKYYKTETAQLSAPHYLNFKTSDYVIDNPILDSLSIPYTIEQYFQNVPLNINPGLMKIYSDLATSMQFKNDTYKVPNTIYSPFFYSSSFESMTWPDLYPPPTYQLADIYIPSQASYLEFISLNPLKFIAKNVLFTLGVYGAVYPTFKYRFNYESLNLKYDTGGFTPIVYENQTSNGWYGFVCDIVFEENINTYSEHAYPIEFNRILEMDGFIQTSGVYDSKSPLKTINPEKCKHIGKVIDRKDCNCPKKWVRQCDLHETTDWKKCMGCPNFEPDED
ncbi:MAG: hypothetical protein EBR30_10630 [Cytophagia bacterium]|nr:hypothetical protein [Cytophagia bacterium]